MKKLNLAIIGQGRSGRDIHGNYYKAETNTYYNVVAVVDEDAARRKRALEEYPGCTVYENYQELYARNDLDLVVNASYSQQHYPITKDLLEHKLNVLVEKPMARNYYECSDLIKTAKDNGVVLAVFQQSFLAPFFIETKKILSSGKIGELKQVNINYSGFSRRWDWQTLQEKLGGSIYNTGPHPIGLALDFLDFSDDVRVAFSKISCELTAGDAEDYAKIILTAPDKPVVDVEISSINAFNDYTLRVQGSKGTYQCTLSGYKMKYIPDGKNPEIKPIKEFICNEDGTPAYCSEKLVTEIEENNFDGSAFDKAVADFYEMLYDTITTGAPLKVTPVQAMKIINVIERVHADNPMPVKF